MHPTDQHRFEEIVTKLFQNHWPVLEEKTVRYAVNRAYVDRQWETRRWVETGFKQTKYRKTWTSDDWLGDADKVLEPYLKGKTDEAHQGAR